MIRLKVNGKNYEAEVDPGVPLLWVLREHLKLLGTKFGCGEGLCGVCIVHLDGEAVRSCQVAVGDVQDKAITTIEGIPDSHPVKVAWIEEQVPQCGYCQPGQIMQAAALVAKNSTPSEENINEALDGVLCRCGTYPRIKRAIIKATKMGAKP
jgi:isoquinoline 1-oxidoreductase subunit alpha